MSGVIWIIHLIDCMYYLAAYWLSMLLVKQLAKVTMLITCPKDTALILEITSRHWRDRN